jgi:hypothetical protein
MYRLFPIILAVIALVAGYGCHDDPTSSYKPEVVNSEDNFHLQMKDVESHDTTLIYYWHMLGSSANIDQSAQIKGGTVSVTVEDSIYQQVYQTDMKTTGSYTTSSGTPGWWRIRFVLKNFSGTIDFRAIRR